jgi:PucR C-terminal helix-turn-helix domain/GGDEF-like domain
VRASVSSSPLRPGHRSEGQGRRPAPAAELLARLRSVAPEVERLLVARAVELEAAGVDPEFMAGVPAAAGQLIGLFADAIEAGNRWAPRVPATVSRQIRYCARSGIPLDVVIRRCHSMVLLLVRRTAEGDLSKDALSYLFDVQSRQGDRLMNAIAAEYRDEVESLQRSPARRLAAAVEKLLAGEATDGTELEYELEGWHLGLIAVGPERGILLDALASRSDCRPLVVPRGRDISWIWLGADRAAPIRELARSAAELAEGVSLAVGEPRQGLEGWRATHREAKTAMGVMSYSCQRVTRCADVVISAALLRHPELRRFLLDAYLRPLDRHRNAGALRKTLRAYLAHGCNAASAATSLGVDRHTIQRRLHRAEQILGRRLDACRAELDVALRLERIGEDEPLLVP